VHRQIDSDSGPGYASLPGAPYGGECGGVAETSVVTARPTVALTNPMNQFPSIGPFLLTFSLCSSSQVTLQIHPCNARGIKYQLTSARETVLSPECRHQNAASQYRPTPGAEHMESHESILHVSM